MGFGNACAHFIQLPTPSTPSRTDDTFAHYLATTWFPGASSADIAPLLALYPSDPAAGSPYGTGHAHAFTPQFKRIAALQGDWFFHAPRRALLKTYAVRPAPVWNYRASRSLFLSLVSVWLHRT